MFLLTYSLSVGQKKATHQQININSPRGPTKCSSCGNLLVTLIKMGYRENPVTH